jgi:hypothetical protein
VTRTAKDSDRRLRGVALDTRSQIALAGAMLRMMNADIAAREDDVESPRRRRNRFRKILRDGALGDGQGAYAQLEIEGPAILTAALKRVRSQTMALVSNVGGVCAEYRDADLIKRLLARLPRDVVLSFRLVGIDLSGSDWSGRFLQGMDFTNCSLVGADFSGSALSDVALNRTAVDGARFTDAAVESLTLGFDERVFGTADALERLATLGADCGFENKERQQTLREKRHEELVELVRGRLGRFYVAGREGSEDSRWDSSIQERNLLGGVKPSDRRFIKSRLIPAMVSCGVLARRRAHGLVIYDLTDAAEDDARALMEGHDLVGTIEAVVDRLEARDASTTKSALGPG